MRTRFLIPAVALLALLAAAIPAFAQEEADDDAPPPSHSAELRVWQSVSDPLDGLWVSARADEDARWTTTALNIAMREGGGWRIDDLTVDALDGELDLRLWQDPSDLRELWLSARPAGGSWEEHGTVRLDLDARSRSGRYRYDDLAVALEWPDAEPPAPGESRDALCIPEGLEKERLFTRVWRSVATPHRYWISARADADARWSTREVSLAAVGEDDGENGWNAGGLTADAGDADFELRLWEGEGGLYLSARVAGTTWDEYGTRRLNLNRTSASGRYTYANRTVRLTLPEAEPPDPGRPARDWDCPGTGAGGGGGTGDGTGEGEDGGAGAPGSGGNTAPTANAGADQHVAPGTASITLDGSGSSDADGDTLTYSWTQTGGTTVKNLTGTDTASPSFAFPDGASAGDTFTFTLTVDDGEGESATDDVTITVNTPPAVNISISIDVTANAQGAGAVSAQANTPSVDCTVAECARRGATVNLTAMVNDPGDTFTYSWAHTGGTYAGSTISLSGGATANASFVMPMSARHGDTVIITLTVTDSHGGTGTATATITATNRVPHADADDDQTASVGDTVTLDGSDSADVDGDTLTYSWAKTGGTYTGAVSLTGATTASPSFDVDAALAGLTAEFTLTVDDGHGGSDTDTVTVTVNQQQGGGGSPPPGGGPGGGQQPISAPNNPPTAHAGPDRHIGPSTTAVQFDGSGSDDSDGDTLTYSWEHTGGTYCTDYTSTSTCKQADLSGITPSFTLPTNPAPTLGQTFIFTLTVSDGEASSTNTDTNTVTITMNTPPTVTLAAPPTNVVSGYTYALSATATDTEDADSSLTLAWSVSPNTAVLALYSPATLTFTTQNWNTAQTVNVKLAQQPAGPVVLTLFAPQGPTMVYSTDSLTFTTTNWDTEQSFTAKLDLLPANTTTVTFPPTVTIPASAAINASYAVSFTATDSHGGSDTASRAYTVNNRPPAIELGDNPANVTTGQTFTLNAASDPDGDTLTYTWSASALTAGAPAATAPGANRQFTVPATARIDDHYLVLVSVADGKDGTAGDGLSFIVNNRPPTVTLPAAPATVTTGEVFTLTATGSDSDANDTLTYTWKATLSGANVTSSVLSGTTGTSATLTIPANAKLNAAYVVTVTVSDGKGGSATASSTYTVNNLRPTVSISGKPATVTAGASYTLTANATDPDNTSYTFPSYVWSVNGAVQTNTTSTHTIAIPQDATLNTTYAVSVQVTDADGATGAGSVTLTVNNRPPTANAGPDQTGPTAVNQSSTEDGNVTVTLDGSGSRDPGDTLTYSWAHLWQNAGGTYDCPPPTPNCTLTATASGATASFTAPGINAWHTRNIGQSMDLIWELTVTDSKGVSVADTVKITVQNAPPSAPMISGTPTNVTTGASYTLTATGSTDPDGTDTNVTYNWSVSGPPGAPAASVSSSGSKSGVVTIPANAAKGNAYKVTAKAVDEDGGVSGVSNELRLTVNNRPPVAGPSGEYYEVQGQRAYLSGQYSRDPDGDTFTCSWARASSLGTYTKAVTLHNPNPIACTDVSTYFVIPSDANNDQTLVFTLTVTDSKGGTATGDWTVTVGDTVVGNSAPTANPGAATRNVSMADTPKCTGPGATTWPKVTLDGSASSDPNGDPLTYWWGWVGGSTGKPGMFTSPHSATAYFCLNPSLFAVNATYQAKLTVHDRHGLSNSSNVSITRKSAKPVVSVSAPDSEERRLPRQSSGPRTINLDATATDPDGTTSFYWWWYRPDENKGTLTDPVTLNSTRDATSAAATLVLPQCTALTNNVDSNGNGYTINLVASASDGAGVNNQLKATGFQTITISLLNRAPKLKANTPINVKQGTNVDINATAHITDPDGDTLTYTAALSLDNDTDPTNTLALPTGMALNPSATNNYQGQITTTNSAAIRNNAAYIRATVRDDFCGTATINIPVNVTN